jgi:DHA1 family multidrug resistance protein-like MFS transporter
MYGFRGSFQLECFIRSVRSSLIFDGGTNFDLLPAWTSRSDIHSIVSLIGVALSSFGIFFTMQSMFLYVPLCYPTYAPSLLAANSLSRSIFAVAAILYAPLMFAATGLGGGVSFVAGVFLSCWGGLIFLYLFGAKLRAKSRFAVR